jgi:hypothetical protein
MNHVVLSTCLVVASLLGIQASVGAEELNLSESLRQALYAGRDRVLIPKTSIYCKSNGVVHDPNVQWRRGYSEDTHGALCDFVFQNVRLIAKSEGTAYSAVKRNALPSRVVSKPFTYRNCTPDSMPINDTLSVTTREGQSITTATAITRGTNVEGSSTVTLVVDGSQLGGGTRRTVTVTTEQREQRQDDFSVDETLTQPLTGLEVATMTEREITLGKELSTDYIEFDAEVLANADVFVRYTPLVRGGVSPLIPVGAITDFTPNKKSPTINLRGRLWNVRAERTIREDRIRPLTREECARGRQPS